MAKKKTSKKTTKKAPVKKATARKGAVQKAVPEKLGPELRADRLVRLAEIEFGKLGKGEEELVRGFTAGRWADLSEFEEADRAVRPGLVRWLCVTKNAHKLADPAGLQLESAAINGAIDLNAADVPFPIRLRGCTIRGAFECTDADLRLLDLQRSSFNGLAGDGVRVRGDVWLRNTPEVAGEVRLLGSTIGGDLGCTGGTFKHANGSAITADGAEIGGSVYMGTDFNALGAIRLVGATIGGILVCTGGAFKNDDGTAIAADRATIRGDVFMDTGFNALGGVRLPGANIGGNLGCAGGTFKNEKGNAIVADLAQIDGSVFIDTDFNALGEVRLLGATIGGDLQCTGGTFKNEKGDRKAITLQSASIEGLFMFKGVASCDGEVDLTACRVDVFVDDLACWPERVLLERFVYGSILHGSLGSLEGRRAWLAKHDATAAQYKSNADSPFDPQPYRQLAEVLRRQGHRYFANEIMFAAAKAQAPVTVRAFRKDLPSVLEGRAWIIRKVGPALGPATQFWFWLLRVLIGYGFRRYLPPVYMLIIIIVGGVIFSAFRPAGVIGPADATPAWMQPTQGLALKAMDERFGGFVDQETKDAASWVEEYPAFRPFAYSADAFLPLVNLHQETYWTPKHWLVKSVYLPLHIAAGWVITTLAAVSFTGLIRQERE